MQKSNSADDFSFVCRPSFQVIADVDLFSFHMHVEKYPFRNVVALLEKGARSKKFSLHEKIGFSWWRRRYKFDHRTLDPVAVKRPVGVAHNCICCRGFAHVVIIDFDPYTLRV